MIIYPAIDIIDRKAVRLYKGDYDKVTYFNDDPVSVALDFKNCGASRVHLVDLDGARVGLPTNFDTVKAIKAETGLLCEIGGGVRTLKRIEDYLDLGIDRVIIGTAAVEQNGFVRQAVKEFGADKIAVGIDVRDKKVATRGWTQTTGIDIFDFFDKMIADGATTFFCTDISKDGAMQGTNVELYCDLSGRFDADLIASGGVSSIDDVKRLRELDIHGAIIGKAYYTGAIDLKEAVEVAK